MVIGIIGENCSGKSTLAEAIQKDIHAEIVTGKDYLRMAKSESEAAALCIELACKKLWEHGQDLFNEWHAKNTSQKVRNVFRNKGMSDADRQTLESGKRDDAHWALEPYRKEMQQAACCPAQLVLGYGSGHSLQTGILRRYGQLPVHHQVIQEQEEDRQTAGGMEEAFQKRLGEQSQGKEIPA